MSNARLLWPTQADAEHVRFLLPARTPGVAAKPFPLSSFRANGSDDPRTGSRDSALRRLNAPYLTFCASDLPTDFPFW